MVVALPMHSLLLFRAAVAQVRLNIISLSMRTNKMSLFAVGRERWPRRVCIY